MLERKIYQELIAWKKQNNKKCLMIKGARQVGKTYIIEKFCKANYSNYFYINFILNSEYNAIFDGNLDLESIVKKLSLQIPEFDASLKDTIIFLDEIQACPEAITALKTLSKNPYFDVITSGSLLGINYKEVPSYPVGYVDYLQMYSLDFEEFCWASGMTKESIGYLKEYFENKKIVPEVTHKKMLDLFKEYIVVGGMPEVVNDFIINHDFNRVLKLQRNIINDYKADMIKYASTTAKTKIIDCFLSIPTQLAQVNKKFKYSLVQKNGKSEKYRSSLIWLNDANITNFCYNLSNLEFPLEGNTRLDVFKVYMADTGLLMAMLEDGSQKEIINGNLGIYKGAIFENIIADCFTKLGKKLYYFEYNSTLEIDFIIRYQDTLTAVEVKSADNTKSKSLTSVMTNWHVPQGIKLSTKNIGYKDNVYNYPLYMVMFL